jgi:poly(A) polymerase
MPEVKSKPHLHASHVDPRAYDIIDRLQKKGFTAYLVGGCVRDLLLHITPKDFDIATNAQPQQIKKNVSGSYIIGKRFKLVLAKRGQDHFEIATFRREATSAEMQKKSCYQDFHSEKFLQTHGNQPLQKEEEISNLPDLQLSTELLEPVTSLHSAPTPMVGFIFDDNFFGSAEQDALRRDFTVNALFYDPIKHDLIDYANAEKDFQHRLIRMIGDPSRRILEDPIRSLRAIRLSHKIHFTLERSLRRAIQMHSSPVALTALPRRREEYLKILKLSHSSRAFFEMFDLGLIDVCLPSLKPLFTCEQGQFLIRHNLDFFLRNRIQQDPQPVELIAPLVLAMVQFFQYKNWDYIEAFLRTEFGAFKTEITILHLAFACKQILPKVEHFKKRSLKRKSSFFQNPWFNLQFEALIFEQEFSPKELLQWEKERSLVQDQHDDQDHYTQ